MVEQAVAISWLLSHPTTRLQVCSLCFPTVHAQICCLKRWDCSTTCSAFQDHHLLAYTASVLYHRPPGGGLNLMPCLPVEMSPPCLHSTRVFVIVNGWVTNSSFLKKHAPWQYIVASSYTLHVPVHVTCTCTYGRDLCACTVQAIYLICYLLI